MAIKYTIEQHAYCFPSKLLAQNGGKHIYNVKLTTAADNGNLIARGDWDSLDLYEEGAVTSFAGVVRGQAANGNYYVEVTTPGDALLVYQVPMIAENWTNNFQKASNFYNEAGDIVRCYELAVGDIFEVSADAFDTTAQALAVGAEIDSVAAKKMKIKQAI